MLSDVQKQTQKPYCPGRFNSQARQTNLQYLLTDREQRCVLQAKAEYKRRFNKTAERDPDLVLYLGDNFGKRKTWSAVSRRLPTMRMSGGKLWSFSRKRWMTGREKMASLGFPVTKGVASATYLLTKGACYSETTV